MPDQKNPVIPEEIQPEKEVTLAGKQEEKLKKLTLRQHLRKFSPANWVGSVEIYALIVLFLVNLNMLYHFFNHPDEQTVFSAPLIPALAKIFFFFPQDYMIRFLLVIFSLALPFSVYIFTKAISQRKLPGFIAAFTVSLPVSFFTPLRVDLGILGVDGPYIASLTLIPLVSLLLLKFIRNGNFWFAIFSSIGMTLIALISPIGLLSFTVFAAFIAFSEMLLGEGRLKGLRFLVTCILTAGFSAFWYNPKFIFLTFNSESGSMIKTTISNLIPPSLFLVPLMVIFGFLLFENRTYLQSAFLAFFISFAFGFLSIGEGFSAFSGSRFLPAFGLSMAIFMGVISVWIFDFLRFSTWFGKKLKRFNKWQETLAITFIAFIAGAFVCITLLDSNKVWGNINERVLGWKTEQSIGIWEIREQTSLAQTIFGYSITLSSILLLYIVRSKLKDQKTS